jgi:hypothetical protein
MGTVVWRNPGYDRDGSHDLEIMTVDDGGETRMMMRVTVGIQSSEKQRT